MMDSTEMSVKWTITSTKKQTFMSQQLNQMDNC